MLHSAEKYDASSFMEKVGLLRHHRKAVSQIFEMIVQRIFEHLHADMGSLYQYAVIVRTEHEHYHIHQRNDADRDSAYEQRENAHAKLFIPVAFLFHFRFSSLDGNVQNYVKIRRRRSASDTASIYNIPL